MDNSIEKIRRNGHHGDGINVGTRGHVDWGKDSVEIKAEGFDKNDEIHVNLNSNKGVKNMWYSDKPKLGGKKLDKKKRKAQRQARKITRKHFK